MSNTSDIVYEPLPKTRVNRRTYKWEPVLREVIDNCPEGKAGRIAIKGTNAAAHGLAQTLRNTAKNTGMSVDVNVRPHDEQWAVWVTPHDNGSSDKAQTQAPPSPEEPEPAPEEPQKAEAKPKAAKKAKTTKTRAASTRRRSVTPKSA